MSRPDPTALLGFFVAVLVAMCGATVWMGGLYIGKHELDMMHLLEMVFRMADGEWPHLDFVTPIGALAMWPISLLVQLGMGVGMAIIFAQVLVALVALPMVWWAAWSRLPKLPAYLFGLFVIVLITALVHGEAERSVSISMHYNRWAWAFAFIAIVVALVQPEEDHALFDGVSIGLSMFILLMIKVTYFGAFAVPILLALILRGAGRTLGVAVVTGLVLVAIPTALAGFGFWTAYLGDLIYVAGSEVRPYPTGSFGEVVGAPAGLGASMVMIAAIILVRQSHQLGGLILLLLAPGFFYVTYQNFANDPQWLYLLAVLLFAFVPLEDIRNGWGWNLRFATALAGGMALALSLPSFFNLAYSPFRHLVVKTEDYVPFFRDRVGHGDLLTARVRAYRMDMRAPVDVEGTPSAPYQDIKEALKPRVLMGEELPICSLELGTIAWFQGMADDLTAAGYAGQGYQILMADLVSSLWLFGDFEPLKGGAPWYYGNIPGLRNADYLLVPMCPATHDISGQILENVEEAGVVLTEERRNKLYILYKIDPPVDAGS